MCPLDVGTMAAVRAQLMSRADALGRRGELAVWLAGVTGAERPAVRARVVVAGARVSTLTARLAAEAGAELVLADAGAAPRRDLAVEPALTVGEVAVAVDHGRALAERAAADGVTFVAGDATGTAATTSATCLAVVLTGRDAGALAGDARVARAVALHGSQARGPLGALRRLGSAEVAVLCGLALGAGEHGLGFLCGGVVATAAAAVAVAVEPELRPRVLAASRSPEPAHGVLLEHLGLEPVLDPGPGADDGAGAVAALTLLRVAAGALATT
jgi:nicotinate-nucleotide--dimethylbenzimidazole phosphoribosyltransferase